MSLSSIRALLVDLSGTIHVENEVVPGAVEAVKKLRDAKVPLKFVTNTTKVGELSLWVSYVRKTLSLIFLRL